MPRTVLGMTTVTLIAGVVLAFGHIASASAHSPAPDGARVYIISPADGDFVTSPVTVRFGLRGMGVAPAGVNAAGTGHHHLIIDAGLPSFDEPIPADEHYRHFGGGQSEAAIELAPGEHTLQLILGDHNHVPHDPPVVSDKVVVTVK